jgi:hypothetical protein
MVTATKVAKIWLCQAGAWRPFPNLLVDVWVHCFLVSFSYFYYTTAACIRTLFSSKFHVEFFSSTVHTTDQNTRYSSDYKRKGGYV